MSQLPPKDIPENLVKEFTLDGKIGVSKLYFDGVSNAKKNNDERYTEQKINEYKRKVDKGGTFYYKRTDVWLHQALKKFPIKNKSVVVMGSASPVYEAFCLSYGCTDVNVIEYNKINCTHPNITFYTPEEYEKNPIKFDCAISISSFEHDGLGRYGDPINPTGDLEIMQKMKDIVKDDGLLFLAVPIAKDKVVWNAHRNYGEVRFPMLIKGWEKIASYGFNKSMFKRDTAPQGGPQPVFVLKNKK